jgi:hypothetical protein
MNCTSLMCRCEESLQFVPGGVHPYGMRLSRMLKSAGVGWSFDLRIDLSIHGALLIIRHISVDASDVSINIRCAKRASSYIDIKCLGDVAYHEVQRWVQSIVLGLVLSSDECGGVVASNCIFPG